MPIKGAILEQIYMGLAVVGFALFGLAFWPFFRSKPADDGKYYWTSLLCVSFLCLAVSFWGTGQTVVAGLLALAILGVLITHVIHAMISRRTRRKRRLNP